MAHVKICGITRPEDAEDAFSLGADFLGLIFAKSARHVDLRTAQLIMEAVPTCNNFVGVFRDHPLDKVKSITDRLGLGYAQLHGNESPDYCGELTKFGISVIKAIPVSDTQITIDALKPYETFAILLDTKVGEKHGGTGKTFDWSLVDSGIPKSIKTFVAGGLRPDNVGSAVEALAPYAVDASSGVEASPGVKDYKLLSSFIRHAKQRIP